MKQIVLDTNVINEECRQQFALILENAKTIFSDQGVSVNAVLMQGDPASVLINYVEKNGIDKIIIGSRGLGLLKSAILGSVTYKVLHNVKIPVTVIK
ncbi:Universal stress protein family protein [Desulfotomaculum arcticum]|uniref:Universal stress protein family protein n=1 Tax=Desulfotruncus arcticus DSM 17038 TaxID=1121424 RepID=A0A1I2Y2R0_9FIRM|nr:universal stress protein [Desulfotruncus arcticus]SFH18611.1 Universal stress protein family protein [Desulfotomaculum arcticum] [Desulfotruncus arcticus DSM 17038]